jgi:apolipoprotein N-acyltransferase
MLRGGHGTRRADMIVTITNDGWFPPSELHQHLAVAKLRCIENRTPTARAVNTGLSGFIDVLGRSHDTLAVQIEGASTAQITLDSRTTVYTRYGDWFATLCVIAAGLVCLWLMYDAARPRTRSLFQSGRSELRFSL